jgi:hypothetical protein
MKIDTKTLSQMKTELLSVFELCEKMGKHGALLDFTEGSRVTQGAYWIKAHVWAKLEQRTVSGEAWAFYESMPKNADHELYPCGTHDNTLATALKAIAKELVSDGISWNTGTGVVRSIA